MASTPSHLLTSYHPIPTINNTHPKPYNIPFPNSLTHLRPNSNSSSLITNAQTLPTAQTNDNLTKEQPKFKWLETNPKDLTEEQKTAISKLPKFMEKRCKAFLRQIICYSPEKGSLSDMLSAWSKIMWPRRADWLAVLKELSYMDHPLFLEISELALHEDSFEVNVRDFTKLIHVYAKNGRLHDAENLFKAMSEKGLTCDQVTLTAIIHMYSKAGNFKLAEVAFEDMKLLGESLDKRSYGSMIMAYIRAGMPNKGEDLIKEMEHQQIYAGREVYKALLREYSMKGDAEGAQRVFDAIQVAGILPDIKLCGLLINAYVVAGQCQKAQLAFENMRKAGIEPTDKYVAVLLSAYEKENNVTAAMDFLVNLEKDNIMIGKEASELLVRWFHKLGVMEDVAQVLREYTTPNESVT